MGKSVGSQELVMFVEALTEIGSKSVICGIAVGVVCVHIAKRNAIRKAVSRIAIGIQTFRGQNRIRQAYTGGAPRLRKISFGDGRIQPGRAEEIDQSGGYVRSAGAEATAAHCKRAVPSHVDPCRDR